MTYPLSRYVREDVSPDMFIEGLHEFLLCAIKDPQNNVAELDKSIEALLQNKIFNFNRVHFGLMFNNPQCAASLVLTNMYLIHLLFYSRVFQKKHDWPIWYLSPISKQLLKQNALNKLPSIYSKYGREIDFNRNVIGLSTCDFFFVSFICYPISIGPQIPRILNRIYSQCKYEWDAVHKEQQKKNTHFILNMFSQILPSSLLQSKQNEIDLEIPSNPFNKMYFWYKKVFQLYLNLFLPPNSVLFQHQRDPQNATFYSDYNLKFIEIVGEMWFGQTFQDRPIGDRHQTLPLMQDLVFRIMEKQIDYQYQYSSSNPYHSRHSRHQRGSSSMAFDSKSDGTSMILSSSSSYHNERLFGLGKIPKTSCICPELRCLSRYLYLFFRESFEHFPLDFIANLQKVIEMLLYVLAPWTIRYKHTKPDQAIYSRKQSEYQDNIKKYQQQRNQSKRSILGMIFDKIKGNKGRMGDNRQNMTNGDLYNFGNIEWNDDRERNDKFNNTQFLTAEDLINYELEGIDESFDIKIWRQYIIEMLPFYSTLINYLIDSLLKYDFSHPLKQLCVLKVLHLYQNEEIVGLIKQTENCLFNPFNNNDNQNINTLNNGFASMDNFANSEPIYIMNIITDITNQRLNEYRCLPFPVHNENVNDLYHGQPQLINIQQLNHSKKITNDKAQQLYIKCRKALTRLSPIIQNNETKQEEEETQNNQQQQQQQQQQLQPPQLPSMQDPGKEWIYYFVFFMIYIIKLLLSSLFVVTGKINLNQISSTRQRQQRQPQQHGSNEDYFQDPQDNVIIIRYIIGEIEQLFNIGLEQRENLMNMSIMYEPSTSVTPQLQRRPVSHSNDNKIAAQQRKYREMYNVWRIPKGEWEWPFILGIHRWIYQYFIFGSPVNDFYCLHLAKYHRLYLCDIRVLSWLTVVVISWFFLHRFIFYLLFIIFIAMFILSLKANML